MRLCRGMPVYKNAADDDWGWDTIAFIVDGTMLLTAYLSFTLISSLGFPFSNHVI